MSLFCRSNIVTPLVAGVFVMGGLSVACRREKERASPAESAGVVTAADTAVQASVLPSVQWDAAAGRGVVVAAGMAPESALVLLPSYVDGQFEEWHAADLRPLVGSRWDLFGRSGAFGSAQLMPILTAIAPDNCTTWPPATFSAAKPGWRIALEAGRASAISLDSLEGMTPADSARFVIEVTRLASSLRGSDDTLFASIPFVVRGAYRFHTEEIDGIFASVQRSIHSEATPREEHMFIIAERPIGSTDGYRVGYMTRTAGLERGATITDVLAMVILSASRRIALVTSHEDDNGGEIWWIERVGPALWRALWRSAATGC